MAELEGAGYIVWDQIEKLFHKVEERVVYTHEQLTDYLKDTGAEKYAKVAGRDLSELIASYKISAVKPKK